ncbi:hypothetical protein [Neobacillus sp. YIM B06451]|uniref:hypothetical protein n=1 Tax=Neobacillus sp. YIM B06451 TaxID=3070994 RepID=UPI00292CEC71|nr:hypothetical protein [Neobacillus sp. YIM B06451]
MNNFDKNISDNVKSYLKENVKFSAEESEKIRLKIQQGSRISRKFNPLYWTVLASAAIIFLVLSLPFLKDSFVGPENGPAVQGSSSDLPEGEELAVDLSDIEQMNIGAEMPRLLYADNNIVVMQGTFGVIVYNMKDSIVSNRISYEQIKSYGISMMLASVSQDGTTIYIGNDDMSMSNEFVFTHQYNISTRVIKKTTQQPTSLYRPKTIEAPGYHEQYDDLQYLTSHNIVELDHSFIYLRSSDWNMKNLQIVNCQYEDGESKVFDVFFPSISNNETPPPLENHSYDLATLLKENSHYQDLYQTLSKAIQSEEGAKVFIHYLHALKQQDMEEIKKYAFTRMESEIEELIETYNKIDYETITIDKTIPSKAEPSHEVQLTYQIKGNAEIKARTIHIHVNDGVNIDISEPDTIL